MKTKSSATKTFISLLSFFAVIAVLMLLGNCQGAGSKKSAMEIDSTLGLKDFYKDYFPIGVAVSPRNLEGEQAEFIKKNLKWSNRGIEKVGGLSIAK